jgi:hypothetical protein
MTSAFTLLVDLITACRSNCALTGARRLPTIDHQGVPNDIARSRAAQPKQRDAGTGPGDERNLAVEVGHIRLGFDAISVLWCDARKGENSRAQIYARCSALLVGVGYLEQQGKTEAIRGTRVHNRAASLLSLSVSGISD